MRKKKTREAFPVGGDVSPRFELSFSAFELVSSFEFGASR
jgi:hypothetical protein